MALSLALQERDGIRAAAMTLFGDLVTAMAGRELSGLRTQVHQSMVPLLLHLKDCCPAVVMVSACRGAFPGWTGEPQVAGGPQSEALQRAVGPPEGKAAPWGSSVDLRWFLWWTEVHPVHACTHTQAHVLTCSRAVCGGSPWPFRSLLCPQHPTQAGGLGRSLNLVK